MSAENPTPLVGGALGAAAAAVRGRTARRERRRFFLAWIRDVVVMLAALGAIVLALGSCAYVFLRVTRPDLIERASVPYYHAPDGCAWSMADNPELLGARFAEILICRDRVPAAQFWPLSLPESQSPPPATPTPAPAGPREGGHP